MRDSSTWYREIVTDLAGAWPRDLVGIKAALLCQVELGLYLLERLHNVPDTGHVDGTGQIDAVEPIDGADGVYALLGGYPFAAASGLSTGTSNHMIVNARHLLWRLRRRRTWRQYLEAYQTVPERMRAYDLSSDLATARRRRPAVAADRFTHYDAALAALPDFRRDRLPIAGPGNSRFRDRGRMTSVFIPEQLCLPEAPGHDLTTPPGATGSPLSIPRPQLADTARWIDQNEARLGLPSGNWSRRLDDVHLEVLTADRRSYQPSEQLTLDGLTHLVGMVGAGKSTLMILIAVWAARRNLRTTIVVGDVAEQLTLTKLFRNLGLLVAPVLGGSTRERHASRLHRRLASRGSDSLLAHHDLSFDDLSTACAIDALRGSEAAAPLRYADAPCVSLQPAKTPKTSEEQVLPEYRPAQGSRGQLDEPQDDDEDRPAHGCPMWSVCPRHGIDRDMVDALIWVANPASLLQSAIPRHLNSERLRRLELACLRSDIVIIDEADRVQMQLDTAFAPSATLVSRGPESWLDRLHTHKIDVLARQGRIPLSNIDVEGWAKSLDVVSAATNHIYAMLISSEDLRRWADTDYFSAWTLQEKLIAEWFPELGSEAGPDEPDRDHDLYDAGNSSDPDEDAVVPASADTEPWAPRRREVIEALDAFRDDPLGDHGSSDPTITALIAQAHNLMHTLDSRGSRQRVRDVLELLLDGSPITDGTLHQPPTKSGEAQRELADIWGSQEWIDRTAQRLEFTLLLATLHHRLARVTFLWPQVEAALRLDATDNELARRPPLDYAPVVPEAPMGNVLGFQYLPDEPEPGPDGLRSGTLRFFRCAGVGRELILNLSALGADPGRHRPGPHVLLMSGTSWAGTSTRSHVLAPVTAVLKPSDAALQAIRRTSFRVEFLYQGNTPLRLSGAKPEARQAILRQMIIKLAKPTPGQPSPLENELRHIADQDRRRALLLVGSYRDAAIVADLLEEIPRWRGKVRVLAADDAELEYLDQVGGDGLTHATALRRGDLASFAEDDQAQILVAPLMAIERGHNILNSQRTAAFGSVFFLARPHPLPDDIGLAIFAINDWVTRFVRDVPGLSTGTFSKLVTDAGRLDAAALALRHVGRREWRRLLSRRYAYSQLDPAEKTSFAWDQLVVIWQVIGRLVRGGVPARVVFVDAAFAPALAEMNAPAAGATSTKHSRKDPGLLLKLHDILAPYFSPMAVPERFAQPSDPELVRILYQPLFDALSSLRTHAFGQLLGLSDPTDPEGDRNGKAV